MFTRITALIGKENIEKIENKKILLVGIGGVGGYTLEALVRSGFLDITIVDGDVIQESNLNRQIISNKENIGKRKVEEAKKRVLGINQEVKMKTKDVFLTRENFLDIIGEKYDYIIDACDDIGVKIELIKYAKINDIKIITCLGTGRKLKISDLEITMLNKTFNDPLARKLRYQLKKENIGLNIPVVFSREEAKDTGKELGSMVFVPAVAGIYLANYVVLDIIED